MNKCDIIEYVGGLKQWLVWGASASQNKGKSIMAEMEKAAGYKEKPYFIWC